MPFVYKMRKLHLCLWLFYVQETKYLRGEGDTTWGRGLLGRRWWGGEESETSHCIHFFLSKATLMKYLLLGLNFIFHMTKIFHGFWAKLIKHYFALVLPLNIPVSGNLSSVLSFNVGWSLRPDYSTEIIFIPIYCLLYHPDLFIVLVTTWEKNFLLTYLFCVYH